MAATTWISGNEGQWVHNGLAANSGTPRKAKSTGKYTVHCLWTNFGNPFEPPTAPPQEPLYLRLEGTAGGIKTGGFPVQGVFSGSNGLEAPFNSLPYSGSASNKRIVPVPLDESFCGSVEINMDSQAEAPNGAVSATCSLLAVRDTRWVRIRIKDYPHTYVKGASIQRTQGWTKTTGEQVIVNYTDYDVKLAEPTIAAGSATYNVKLGVAMEDCSGLSHSGGIASSVQNLGLSGSAGQSYVNGESYRWHECSTTHVLPEGGSGFAIHDSGFDYEPPYTSNLMGSAHVHANDIGESFVASLTYRWTDGVEAVCKYNITLDHLRNPEGLAAMFQEPINPSGGMQLYEFQSGDKWIPGGEITALLEDRNEFQQFSAYMGESLSNLGTLIPSQKEAYAASASGLVFGWLGATNATSRNLNRPPLSQPTVITPAHGPSFAQSQGIDPWSISVWSGRFLPSRTVYLWNNSRWSFSGYQGNGLEPRFVDLHPADSPLKEMHVWFTFMGAGDPL